jgi:hypothetical protein
LVTLQNTNVTWPEEDDFFAWTMIPRGWEFGGVTITSSLVSTPNRERDSLTQLVAEIESGSKAKLKLSRTSSAMLAVDSAWLAVDCAAAAVD